MHQEVSIASYLPLAMHMYESSLCRRWHNAGQGAPGGDASQRERPTFLGGTIASADLEPMEGLLGLCFSPFMERRRALTKSMAVSLDETTMHACGAKVAQRNVVGWGNSAGRGW